jgi:hypothetical protein
MCVIELSLPLVGRAMGHFPGGELNPDWCDKKSGSPGMEEPTPEPSALLCFDLWVALTLEGSSGS